MRLKNISRTNMWYVETLSHHRRELISNIEIISVIVRIPGLDYFLVLLLVS